MLIEKKVIAKMTHPLEKYTYLLETSTDYLQKTPHPDPISRSPEQLKQRLQKSYPSLLRSASWNKNGKFQSSLAYSMNFDIDTIVQMPYELNNET